MFDRRYKILLKDKTISLHAFDIVENASTAGKAI